MLPLTSLSMKKAKRPTLWHGRKFLPQSLTANPSIKLYPGMPAEVLIVHKARRAIDYIAGPITDSFNRAFRED